MNSRLPVCDRLRLHKDLRDDEVKETVPYRVHKDRHNHVEETRDDLHDEVADCGPEGHVGDQGNEDRVRRLLARSPSATG